MCQYCGCREMPLLRDYIAEHERAVNHTRREAVRALDGEENGLFWPPFSRPSTLGCRDGRLA